VDDGASITKEQLDVAAQVDATLRAHHAKVERQDVSSTRNRPCVSWKIATRPDIGFELVLFEDSFQIVVNGWSLPIERVGKFAEFAAGVREVTESLLSHDLRIRVRRTLGGRSTGALLLGSHGRARWCGDLLAAVFRMGREERYADWLERQTVT